MAINKFYNSTCLKEELCLVMEDESDVIDFANMLEKIRNLGTHSPDRRQIVLSDLIFWKAQFENQKKQLEIRMKNKEALEYQKIYNKLKLVSKPTEAQIRAELDATSLGEEYENYKQMFLVCEKWVEILGDLYFTSQITHKILGNAL